MTTNTITIEEITFYTGKDEISIKGRMQQDQFSYQTCIYISSTSLNKIINYVQRMNEDKDICESFSVSIDPEGNQFMWLDTVGLNEITVPCAEIINDDKPLRIRA